MNRRGFTLAEVFIVVLITALLFGLIGTFIWRNARTSRATDRKLQAISAVHYLQGRLRRDMKGASSFEVSDGGKALAITDGQGRKRLYQFKPDERTLTLPDLVDPAATVTYDQARFRDVRFLADADGGGITYVASAVPFYDTGAKLTEEELGWGSAIAGRVALGSRVQSIHFPGANMQGLLPR